MFIQRLIILCTCLTFFTLIYGYYDIDSCVLIDTVTKTPPFILSLSKISQSTEDGTCSLYVVFKNSSNSVFFSDANLKSLKDSDFNIELSMNNNVKLNYTSKNITKLSVIPSYESNTESILKYIRINILQPIVDDEIMLTFIAGTDLNSTYPDSDAYSSPPYKGVFIVRPTKGLLKFNFAATLPVTDFAGVLCFDTGLIAGDVPSNDKFSFSLGLSYKHTNHPPFFSLNVFENFNETYNAALIYVEYNLNFHIYVNMDNIDEPFAFWFQTNQYYTGMAPNMVSVKNSELVNAVETWYYGFETPSVPKSIMFTGAPLLLDENKDILTIQRLVVHILNFRSDKTFFFKLFGFNSTVSSMFQSSVLISEGTGPFGIFRLSTCPDLFQSKFVVLKEVQTVINNGVPLTIEPTNEKICESNNTHILYVGDKPEIIEVFSPDGMHGVVVEILGVTSVDDVLFIVDEMYIPVVQVSTSMFVIFERKHFNLAVIPKVNQNHAIYKVFVSFSFYDPLIEPFLMVNSDNDIKCHFGVFLAGSCSYPFNDAAIIQDREILMSEYSMMQTYDSITVRPGSTQTLRTTSADNYGYVMEFFCNSTMFIEFHGQQQVFKHQIFSNTKFFFETPAIDTILVRVVGSHKEMIQWTILKGVDCLKYLEPNSEGSYHLISNHSVEYCKPGMFYNDFGRCGTERGFGDVDTSMWWIYFALGGFVIFIVFVIVWLRFEQNKLSSTIHRINNPDDTKLESGDFLISDLGDNLNDGFSGEGENISNENQSIFMI
eukprot:TRINITY_DN1081_c0_g1_i1.p1 TRINITY_DN1081_c0_g1~~TRINITY_DN1081_c0_g1_i1.p1  ORF type:complete len:771 (+),score=103.04 TRINITY_DN1081_c0_g1_i1:29-2341(+)